jgi:HAD superfamily hydrolase (TIGR01509 family)
MNQMRSAGGRRWSVPIGGARSSVVAMRRVGGLLFDPGDVLYDASLWRRWLFKLLARLGLRTNYRSFFHLWDHEYLADVYRGKRDFHQALETFLLAAGLSRGQIDEVGMACKSRRCQDEAAARPLAGAKATLRAVRASGTVLGVVGNYEHPAAALAGHLDHLGLGGLFDAVVSSFDLGATLPEPACYHAALAAMGLPPEQVAFVGHDSEELAGAARVGMQTIAFNFDPEAQADVYLVRFDELLELVSTRSTSAAAG